MLGDDRFKSSARHPSITGGSHQRSLALCPCVAVGWRCSADRLVRAINHHGNKGRACRNARLNGAPVREMHNKTAGWPRLVVEHRRVHGRTSVPALPRAMDLLGNRVDALHHYPAIGRQVAALFHQDGSPPVRGAGAAGAESSAAGCQPRQSSQVAD